jgi:hypothetical protein
VAPEGLVPSAAAEARAHAGVDEREQPRFVLLLDRRRELPPELFEGRIARRFVDGAQPARRGRAGGGCGWIAHRRRGYGRQRRPVRFALAATAGEKQQGDESKTDLQHVARPSHETRPCAD